MNVRELPPLPGVDPVTAPTPDDPGYSDWVESVAISPEGVDRMQIWWMLHRTPTERLEALQGLVDGIMVLRGARRSELP